MNVGSVSTPARQRPLWTTILWGLFAVAVAGSAIGHMRSWITPSYVPVDFSPFYCAGKVVVLRQDPYLEGPLRTCEESLGRAAATGNAAASGFVVNPAPLPGYDFVPLAALALLPFQAAKIVFGFVLLLSVAVTGICVAKLSPLPIVAAIAVAYMAAGYQSTGLGQLAPIAIVFVAVAAVAVRNGKSIVAACALCAAMVQPQIAIFPVIALFVFASKARLPLAVLFALLAAGSVAVLGIGGNLEYLRVLPLHAATEFTYGGQYSVSALLATIGVNRGIAMFVGTASSVVAIACVLAILGKGRRRGAYASGAVILIPAAFAAIGGTYIHATQIAVTLLPAIAFMRPTNRWVLPSFALAALCVPLAEIPNTHLGVETLLIYGLALTCSWLLIFFLSEPAKARQRATAISLFLLLYVVAMAALRPHVREVPFVSATAGDSRSFASASDPRSDAADAVNRTTGYRAYYFFLRLPTWIAVIVVAASSSAAFLRSVGVRPTDAGKRLIRRPIVIAEPL